MDLTRRIAKIDPKIYGHFVEHFGRCIYGGIYEEGSALSDPEGFRKDVLAAAQRLRVPVLRWPGGNFVFLPLDGGYRAKGSTPTNV